MAYKTPGVYVEEISLFPPSVAEVETAIPVFIGYTEKAERKGEDLTQVPTKIRSLLEFHELFGGEFPIGTVKVKVDENNNYAVTSATPAKRFYLYESLRLFFNNGGGKCYIVSVGGFGSDPTNAVSFTALSNGIKALEKYDEPTIITVPDAVLLTTENNLYTLQQNVLSQCAKLQDRVGVFDLYEGGGNAWSNSIQNFRNAIGINNLKYGAAYTPWLHSAIPKTANFSLFRSAVINSTDAAVDLAAITADSALNGLVKTAADAVDDVAEIAATRTTQKSTSPTLQDRYNSLKSAIVDKSSFVDYLTFLRELSEALVDWKGSLKGRNLRKDLDAYAESILVPALTELIAREKNPEVISLSNHADEAAVNNSYAKVTASGWLDATAVVADGKTYSGADDLAKMLLIAADIDPRFSGNGSILAFIDEIESAAATHANMAQTVLYAQHSIIGNIANHIQRELAKVPPSGAVAGVYAMVDRTRGVWKAPANVSLSSVLGPVIAIDDAEQEDLNVDVNGGKSVNAIRTFTGRGTLVWGARTLAGNDNEWRYVSVRRFYNMVEESVKKSTAWAVFEPNSKPLWVKVKGMIDNYLVQKWREGALAGATPEEAFFVKIGLGETMTAQDILEGRLIVEIGMAVVRPAEFIILKFSHKMQES